MTDYRPSYPGDYLAADLYRHVSSNFQIDLEDGELETATINLACPHISSAYCYQVDFGPFWMTTADPTAILAFTMSWEGVTFLVDSVTPGTGTTYRFLTGFFVPAAESIGVPLDPMMGTPRDLQYIPKVHPPGTISLQIELGIGPGPITIGYGIAEGMGTSTLFGVKPVDDTSSETFRIVTELL